MRALARLVGCPLCTKKSHCRFPYPKHRNSQGDRLLCMNEVGVWRFWYVRRSSQYNVVGAISPCGLSFLIHMSSDGPRTLLEPGSTYPPIADFSIGIQKRKVYIAPMILLLSLPPTTPKPGILHPELLKSFDRPKPPRFSPRQSDFSFFFLPPTFIARKKS